MALFNASTIVLLCLTFHSDFSNGSVSVTRILNVGDNMTLDCVTDWDPDIDMYWTRRKNGLDQYLAKAVTSFANVEIYEYFRNDSRNSVSYHVLSDNMSMNLVLRISNITEQDSAE